MKLNLTIILLGMLLASCKKDVTLSNLNGNKIGCFGHAGMGSKSIYPANTLESFVNCLNRGADGTEMDIQVTKDGVLVIYHNDNLSGVTECGGVIRDLYWDEINKCRVNSLLFKNLNVISFDEFIQNISSPNFYTYTFDCKLTNGSDDNNEYYKRFANAIVNTTAYYSLQQNVFIESTDASFLNLIKLSKTDLKLFLLGEDYSTDIKTVVQNGFYGLSMDSDRMNTEQIADAHAQGVRVTLYGVETNKQNYAAVEKQPDFIQTDDLNYLLRIFGKINRKKGYLYTMIEKMQ